MTKFSLRVSKIGIAAVASVLLVGKKRSTIKRRVCKHMGLIILAGGLAVAGFKTFYQTAVLVQQWGKLALSEKVQENIICT